MSGQARTDHPPCALINARVFDGKEFRPNQAVLLENGRINGLCARADISSDFTQLDLQGLILAPGLIDLQVNGGDGAFFNDCETAEAVHKIANCHRAFGTTGMLPTVISDHETATLMAVNSIAESVEASPSPVLGIHLEGPFLNPDRAGIHDQDRIRRFDAREMAAWEIARFPHRMITIAPECLTQADMKLLKQQGFHIFAGHTLMTAADLELAFLHGLSGLTHLFNAMPAIATRDAGPVPAFLSDPLCYAGIIVDGHHVDPTLVKLALSQKQSGRLFLVTDAMAAAGTGVTSFTFQDQEIQVSNRRCHDQSGTLAGSNLTMIDAVANVVTLLDLPLSEALRMGSLYPAECLGLSHQLGRIARGYRANLVAFDDQFKVHQTWISGDLMRHS